MASKYISLETDKSRLISIFESEIKDGENKQLTIYCYEDKKLPPNPIVYYHAETINELQVSDILKIINTDRNIDMQGEGFGGPPFYIVEVFGNEVKKQIQASKTTTKQPPKPLPEGVNWTESEDKYSLEFKDGKSFEFNDISKESARYFKLLKVNHGLYVKHKDVIEEIEEIKSTEQIRNLVKTIKAKIKSRELTKRIHIETEFNSAYMLTVS